MSLIKGFRNGRKYIFNRLYFVLIESCRTGFSFSFRLFCLLVLLLTSKLITCFLCRWTTNLTKRIFNFKQKLCLLDSSWKEKMFKIVFKEPRTLLVCTNSMNKYDMKIYFPIIACFYCLIIQKKLANKIC